MFTGGRFTGRQSKMHMYPTCFADNTGAIDIGRDGNPQELDLGTEELVRRRQVKDARKFLYEVRPSVSMHHMTETQQFAPSLKR